MLGLCSESEVVAAVVEPVLIAMIHGHARRSMNNQSVHEHLRVASSTHGIDRLAARWSPGSPETPNDQRQVNLINESDPAAPEQNLSHHPFQVCSAPSLALALMARAMMGLVSIPACSRAATSFVICPPKSLG